jgi:competence ComEA-like helix-hairpin-helix protein
MAKLNVNMATREELVEAAGLRPDLAEAILKFRGKHGGKITDVNALEELPGVGPATIEQLRKALDFSERKTGGQNGQGESAGNGNERAAQESAHAARETAERATETVAATARRSAEAGREVTAAGAETASAAARGGLQLVQRLAGGVGEVQRETARQSTESVAEIGKLWVELLNEQTRHNLQLAATLGRAVNWDELFQLQGEFVRASFERLNQLNSRYLEVVQTMTRATTAAAERQRRDAA